MTRVIIGALAAAAVIAIAWFFALWSPAGEQLTALRDQTEQLETQQNQLRTQLAQLQDIRSREVQIRADLGRLEQFVPTNPSQASLIRQVQDAADASGVEIFTLTFADPEPVEGAPAPAQPGLVLGAITAGGVVEGGYFQIVDFFRRLEVEVARAILLETVDLSEADAGFPRLAATFTADIFALITEPVNPNAAPAPTPEPTEGATESAGGEETSGLPVSAREVVTR